MWLAEMKEMAHSWMKIDSEYADHPKIVDATES
jgi:hypothetical protein